MGQQIYPSSVEAALLLSPRRLPPSPAAASPSPCLSLPSLVAVDRATTRKSSGSHHRCQVERSRRTRTATARSRPWSPFARATGSRRRRQADSSYGCGRRAPPFSPPVTVVRWPSPLRPPHAPLYWSAAPLSASRMPKRGRERGVGSGHHPVPPALLSFAACSGRRHSAHPTPATSPPIACPCTAALPCREIERRG